MKEDEIAQSRCCVVENQICFKPITGDGKLTAQQNKHIIHFHRQCIYVRVVTTEIRH